MLSLARAARAATARPALRATTSTTAMATSAKGPGTFTYEWPRPGLTVDVAVFAPPPAAPTTAGGDSPAASATRLLLIQRGQAPGAGRWALPGGFVEPDEHLDAAAARELAEETGLALGGEGGGGGGGGGGGAGGLAALRQVRAFGGPDRDPRGWTVTVAYAALVPPAPAPPAVAGGDDAAAAQWWPVGDLPALAFDHAAIIAAACRSVAGVEGVGTHWAGELVAGAEALEAREWVPTRE
jgi:8-oxo-dGTP diphosphatase